MEDKITISLEEYKELLIIKGKYEELNSKYMSFITKTKNGSLYMNTPNIALLTSTAMLTELNKVYC